MKKLKDKDKKKAELIKELKTLWKKEGESVLNDFLKYKQNEEKYQSFTKGILDSSVVGMFILDSDFKVVWINHSTEKYFGLQREKVIGKDKRKLIKKNIQHIFEDPDEFIRKVFATYDNNTYIENFECHVLPEGKRKERWLEHWSQPIKSGLYKGGRIEHYYDITKRKQAEEKEKEHHKNIELLSKTAMQFVEFPQGKDIYTFIGEKLRELIGKESYIVINSVDEETSISTIRAVLGLGKFTDKIAKFLGRHPVGMTFNIEDTNQFYADGKMHLYEEGLYGILLKTVPKVLCKSMEKLMNVKKIYILDLVKKRHFFGSVIIFLKESTSDLKNKQTIETFIKQASIAIQRRQAEERLKKTLDATIETMSKIIEVKDPYTHGHQHRVCQLATRIAQEMKLPKDKIEGIRIASLIHDIGKIGLPAEILSKPTKLIDIEFNLIKGHSQTGYDILKSIDFSYPVANIVLQHHERLDGSGYPNNLKGDEILLEARILGVADVVEAMSSHRPYRPALGIDVALEEITQNKGILYDPEVVDTCFKLFREKGFKFE